SSNPSFQFHLRPHLPSSSDKQLVEAEARDSNAWQSFHIRHLPSSSFNLPQLRPRSALRTSSPLLLPDLPSVPRLLRLRDYHRRHRALRDSPVAKRQQPAGSSPSEASRSVFSSKKPAGIVGLGRERRQAVDVGGGLGG
ncbi:hypothetical protein LINPERPRIM_LOCUS11037, partial [Linum perenne]